MRSRCGASIAAAACVTVLAFTTDADAAAQETAAPLLDALTIIAPAAPGGGWDQLAREMQREIERQQLASVAVVENIPGAAGTIGLAQMVSGRRGDGQTLLVNGLVMLGAILWNQSPVSITQATPIARLTGEYEIVAVPAASPHRDMPSLVRALRENPAAVSWGGGSAGGTDHILAGLIVSAAGVDPRRTNYIAFSGGGEAVTALIGGQVTAGISGYSEFAQHIESGRLRAIGISSARRVPGLDVPTLMEQELDVELENWRAVIAPPGLTDDQRGALLSVVETMASSETWQATLDRHGWSGSFLSGPAFEEFLDQERVRVGRIVFRLRGSGGESSAARVGEWVFPSLVLAGSAVLFVMLVLRGRTGLRDGVHGPVVRVLAGLVAFVTLLNAAGFVVSGTALFACTASAFGSRRWWRDALVGLVLGAAVYVAFTRGLRRTAAGRVASPADAVETLTALAGGFAVALTPENLLWALAGVTLGTAIGVLPGIGPALTVALLLPVTYSLDPTAAFIMFAGIYYGGMYGGSTTSILLNTPGESSSVMSAVEGHLMARAGRGGAALATAAIGSFVAGTLATAALTVSAPIMVEVALRFGPAEYFALAVLAFVAVSAVLGESRVNGFASLLFGLLLGVIGIDPLTGVPRLTFGIPQLLDGIDVVLVAVGLFAVGEALYAASRHGLDTDIVMSRGSLWMTRSEWARSWKPWLRGTAIGFPLGALPAGGAEIPTFLSYALERRLAGEPNEFGRGAIEGVAGRKPPTTRRRPARWSRCSRSGSRRRPRPRSCWPRFSNTDSSPGHSFSSTSRGSCGD